MKFCQNHWDMLREQVRDHGLEQFVSQGGLEAAKRLEAGGFDPLMHGHNYIVTLALERCGSGLLMDDGAGHSCPTCALSRACGCGRPDCAKVILRTVMRATKEEAVRLGLMGAA